MFYFYFNHYIFYYAKIEIMKRVGQFWGRDSTVDLSVTHDGPPDAFEDYRIDFKAPSSSGWSLLSPTRTYTWEPEEAGFYDFRGVVVSNGVYYASPAVTVKVIEIKITHIDKQFAPIDEVLDIKYTLAPANFTAPSAKLEISRAGAASNPIHTDVGIPTSMGKKLEWNGKEDGSGTYTVPGEHTVVFTIGLPDNAGEYTCTTNTAVKIHTFDFIPNTPQVFASTNLNMSFTTGTLDNLALTNLHVEVKLLNKHDEGVITRLPMNVIFTAEEGTQNVAETDSFKYNETPARYLGKKGGATANYWAPTPGKSVSPGSADGYRFEASSMLITANGNNDIGKSFMTFLPSGVGGGTFMLTGVRKTLKIYFRKNCKKITGQDLGNNVIIPPIRPHGEDERGSTP